MTGVFSFKTKNRRKKKGIKREKEKGNKQTNKQGTDSMRQSPSLQTAVVHLVKTFPSSIEIESSLSYLKKPTIGPFPETDSSSPQLYTLLLQDPF
jgi:hypothetical protein